MGVDEGRSSLESGRTSSPNYNILNIDGRSLIDAVQFALVSVLYVLWNE